MAEYISREKAIKELREVYENEYPTASGDFDEYASHDVPNVLRNIPAADVQPVEKTEFQKGYEQGFNDGRASAALPNTIDNGDKIDGYTYMYKTDSRGEPYIHIDSVRNMLKKSADVQPVDSWISVNDRLPEAVEEDVNGKIAFSKSVLVYLVYDNGFTYITNDRFRVDSKSWLHEIPGEGCKVTHWMPLPEPPKDGDTNG